MNIFKFNSFLKTSENTQKYTTEQTKYPHKSSFSLPELKQQMLQAITQKRKTQVFKKLHKKYPTPLSLLDSNISIPIAQQKQIDIPLGLLNLSVNVTQQILALRQDKLTLMQQYNKILQNRFKLDREILSLKRIQMKQKQMQQEQKQKFQKFNVFSNSQSYTNSRQNSKQKISESSNKLTSQQESKKSLRQQKQRRISIFAEQSIKEQQDLLSYIQKLQESSRVIQNKINVKEIIIKSQNLGFSQQFSVQNQFITENKTQELIQQRTKLRINRDKLLRILADRSPSNYNTKTSLYRVVLQNRQLLNKLDKVESNNQNYVSLRQLRLKCLNQQNEKAEFFQNLLKFKQEIKRYKKQNSQLKQTLNQFQVFYNNF